MNQYNHSRKDYLDHKISHYQYYIELAHDCNIVFTDPNDPLVQRCLQANRKTDAYFNKVAPLATWDRLVPSTRASNFRRLQEAFKARGDFWSVAGHVCMLKAAMREALHQVDPSFEVEG